MWNPFNAPIVFIGNGYRRQLFEPFMKARTFGDEPPAYLTSTRLLNCSAAEASLYQWILSRARLLVISDAEGADVLKRYQPNANCQIYWFCWNSMDDACEWSQAPFALPNPFKICFLFSDEAENYQRATSRQSRSFQFPVLPAHRQSRPKYLLSYLGEVDVISDLKTQNPKLDQQLWELSERFTQEESLGLALGTVDFEKIATPKISPARLVWILKNRVRFQYGKRLKEKYGSEFLLVGDDWKKLGLDARSADYNPKSRFKIYSESRLCLDFLSKSTLEAHYPRSAEIISYSDGLLQMSTIDSPSMLGDQTAARTFHSFSDLCKKIDQALAIQESEFHRQGQELRQRLILSTKTKNRLQL